jgi:hypothetical protein
MENENPNLENNMKRMKKLILYISICVFGFLFIYYSSESNMLKVVHKVEQTQRFLTNQFKKNMIINETSSTNLHQVIEHNNYTQRVKKFYQASSKNVYKGTWKSNVILPNMEKKHGIVTVEMTYSDSNQTYNKIDINHFLFTYLQLLDGETVDKWIEIRLHGILQMNGTNFNFANKTVNGTDYFTSVITGEVLDRKNQFCKK